MSILVTTEIFAHIELRLTSRGDIAQLASILTEAADNDNLCDELEQLKDRLKKFLDDN